MAQDETTTKGADKAQEHQGKTGKPATPAAKAENKAKGQDATKGEHQKEGKKAPSDKGEAKGKAPKPAEPKKPARAAKQPELKLPGQDTEATKTIAMQFFAGAGAAAEPPKAEHQGGPAPAAKEAKGKARATAPASEAGTADQTPPAKGTGKAPASGEPRAPKKIGRKPRADKPADEVPATVRLSAALLEKITALASFDRESVSSITARLLEQYAEANAEKLAYIEKGRALFNGK